ncbi:xanthine dehydrogenase family protein molybdopterin-binding subunit [Leptospira sp. severe_002]|uniref:xanthine dehydrogenase family protein molybdopterin-binding subunit n=1 Tax=Leptospira sp. severe_002 TaxID=2838237 RepID=UPI001E500A21|nr:xanthine dehydrogenase family protein molybdopterin-binding subunit [Leptospira sp. severe_002]
MGEFAIGQAVPRFEDPRLLRGGGQYVDDIVLPGMAYGHVLRSPHAHAKIKSMNTKAAEAAPGVLCVLTGKDWIESGWGDMPVPATHKRRDGSPNYQPPYPALVKDTVRFVGDYVAFVVAETKNQAMDASELIEVDYEILPAIIATPEAAKPGATLVWPDCKDNICFTAIHGNKAATEEAFKKAAHVVKEHLVINRVTTASMEPRGSVGDYNAITDHYTLYTTLQRAHPYRAELAKLVLKVPEHKIRVIAPDIGGSFGMKSAIYNEVPLVLLASKKIGRPVKWMSTRSEAFLSDAQARDNVTDAELALDKDGRFLAFRVNSWVNAGAYLQSGFQAYTGNLGTLAGVYTTPAMYVESTAVFTHTQPMRPYRGNGRPEAAYVIERMVDVAAKALDMEPAEIRRKNYIAPEQMPFKTSLTFTYDSGEFEKGMDLAIKLADVAGFNKRKAESKKRGKLRGIGMSNTIERAAAPSFEGAEIRFDRGGTVSIFSGSINQGQGHHTTFAQIVADKLGIHPDDIEYIQGDTDKVFFGEGTGGSRSATMSGSAFHIASEKVIDKAKKIAAHHLKVDVNDVKFEEGLFSSAKTNQTITIKEVAENALNPAKLPKDMEAGLHAQAVYKADVENFPNGVHFCEVEIDPETGKSEIVKYSVVDDVGTVINPLLLKGQIVGGVAMGVGQILKEDINFDADGQLVTGSFMDYAMPRAHDMCSVEVKANPVPTKTNPIGAKGAGEAGCVGAMPAVANALVDALAPYGVQHIEMPATAERVWRIINNGKPA